MARPIVALALLAMLTIASAERSLLASKYNPAGGSNLHGLAISSYAGTMPSALVLPQSLPNLGYFSSNGNGTWVATRNLALTIANSNLGALSGSSLVGTTPGVPAFASSAGAGSNFLGSTLGSGYNGITSVAFPSKMLGVAVGLSAGNAQITPCPPSSVVSAATCQANWQGPPNILITVDQGATWEAVTGFGPTPPGSIGAGQVLSATPAAALSLTAIGTGILAAPVPTISTTGTPATVTSYPNGFIAPMLATVGANGGGATVAAAQAQVPVVNGVVTSVPAAITGLLASASPFYTASIMAGSPIATNYPYLQAPDLLSVFCVNRNTCFAAGGFMPTSTASGSPPGIGAANSLPTYGQILVSTNGATQWSYAAVPTSVPASALAGQNCAAGSGLCPTPGLLSIGADASGKHVYAVGAPAQLLAVAGVPAVNAYTASTASGVILYSGNAGVSFTYQAAPLVSGRYYSLTSVAVLRGTIAFAGGNLPFASSSANVGGLIIATFNGGFTWSLQTSSSNLAINAVSFYSKVGKYYGFAAADMGVMLSTVFNQTTVSNLIAPTVTTWTAVALPAIVTSSNHLLGVSWDNNLKGYAFGYGTILSTANGGQTWVSETPSSIYSATAAAAVATGVTTFAIPALASVPTSY
jgi:hypothetical protein